MIRDDEIRAMLKNYQPHDIDIMHDMLRDCFDEVERLRAESHEQDRLSLDVIEHFKANLAKARAALEWYGDKSNWLAGSDDWSRADNDSGGRARQTLTEIR